MRHGVGGYGKERGYMKESRREKEKTGVVGNMFGFGGLKFNSYFLGQVFQLSFFFWLP